MSKKNQIAFSKISAQKIKITSTRQKSIDNRSNQLNPNNIEYQKVHINKNIKLNYMKDDHCNWDEDSFGDDWEFNHD